jgi:DNA-binding response OmpR family regulator
MDTNKKILVVDDEMDLTQMIGFQFTSKGFEVQTAGDGLEGLQKAYAFRPDLIILDMNMPRMGGIEFYNKICGTDGRPMFPVLVLTARANIQGLFKDLHINGFMIKPFEIDQLIHEAELIIKNKCMAQAKANRGLLGPPRRVCIVEQDLAIMEKVSGIFLKDDYTVTPAKSGAVAIEKIMNDVPHVAVVQLGLSDIAGDIVIFKLSQMAKTMAVKFILYTSCDIKHNRRVMDRISIKSGIFTFVEYKELEDLLVESNRLFEES